MYKHLYGDFAKDEKEYQDTICSEAEKEKQWQTLRSAVRPCSQSSRFTARPRRPLGHFHSRKEFSLWLFWSWWLLGNIPFVIMHQNNSICGRRVAQRPCNSMTGDWFASYAKELLTATNLESEVVEVTKLVTSRWILSNLTANLKHHMSYSCWARKYGTLLYRSKSNLLSPLAQALWRVWNLSKTSTIQVCSDPVTKQDVSSNERVFDELNNQIHSQITRTTRKRC